MVLNTTLKLIQAYVDVIVSSSGSLNSILHVMNLSQLIVQAMQRSDSPLLQLPHFDANKAAKFRQKKVEDIADFLDLEEEDRG